jgi:hypothetical protein
MRCLQNQAYPYLRFKTLPSRSKPVGGAIVSQLLTTRDDNFVVVAAEREDAGRFIVHAHDMPAAFVELRATIHRKLRSG